MSPPIFSIQKLSKVYPGGIQGLKGISFDVQKGEFIAVIGLSGSGKSTLLRCLNRLHESTGGKIYFNGIDTAELKSSQEVRALRQKIAMVFQYFNLIPRHTVLSNVLVGQLATTSTLKSLFGIFSRSDKDDAMNCLRQVGIDNKAHVRADQLSGGQQQRVAIARALAQKPKVILADEPVASLDPATCNVVMDYLKKINQELGITVICNLHFLSLVRQYATRVIALKNGELIYDGDPQKIDTVMFEKIYGEGSQEVHIR